MINNNYLPIKYHIKSKQDLMDLMNRKLGDLTCKLEKESFPTLFLILMLYAPLTSIGELVFYFDFEPFNLPRRHFDKMKSQGLVRATTLYPPNKERQGLIETYDDRTSTAYVLTKTGFKSVMHYRGLTLGEMPKFKSERYNAHTYSVGMNFYSILSNPFLTSKIGYHQNEIGATFGKRTSGDGRSIYIDSYFEIGRTTLYLEEDLGTMKKESELKDKLSKYGFHSDNLLSGNNKQHIIMSFRKPFICIYPQRNTANNLRYKESIIKTVIEEIRRNEPLLTEHTLENLVKLLNSKKSDIDKTNAETINKYYKDVLSNNLLEYINSIDSLEDLISGLATYSSAVYSYDFAKRQLEFSLKKRNFLLKSYSEELSKAMRNRTLPVDDMLQTMLIGGHGLYCLSTTLLSNQLPLVMYSESFLKEVIENTITRLVPFFEGFDSSTYSPFLSFPAKEIRIPNGPVSYLTSFHNCYECDNAYIFIENMSLDIGATMRIFSSMYSIRQDIDKYMFFICLCMDDNDAVYFSKSLKLYNLKRTSKVQVYFLNYDNLYIKKTDSWDHYPLFFRFIDDDYTLAPHSALYRFTDSECKDKAYLEERLPI